MVINIFILLLLLLLNVRHSCVVPYKISCRHEITINFAVTFFLLLADSSFAIQSVSADPVKSVQHYYSQSSWLLSTLALLITVRGCWYNLLHTVSSIQCGLIRMPSASHTFHIATWTNLSVLFRYSSVFRLIDVCGVYVFCKSRQITGQTQKHSVQHRELSLNMCSEHDNRNTRRKKNGIENDNK